jgi:hypothetical protein
MPKLASSESPAEILQGMHLDMLPLINNGTIHECT